MRRPLSKLAALGLAITAVVVTGMNLMQDGGKIRIIPQPLRLMVEVAGKEYHAVVDQPFEVEVDGNKVPVQISVLPTLRFQQAGLQFDYPRHFTFELDEEEPSVTIWTVEGADVVFMVQQYHDEIPLTALCELVADSTLAQYDGIPARKKEASLTIAGKEYQGYRLEADVAGYTLIQYMVGVPTKGEPVLLMLMDVPDEVGTNTAEWDEALGYLDRSLVVDG